MWYGITSIIWGMIMAKKIGGLDTFFQTNKVSVERTRKVARTAKHATLKETESVIKNESQDDEKGIRATFIINPKQLYQLKAIAYWDRLKIKDVLDTALTNYFQSRGDMSHILTKRKGK